MNDDQGLWLVEFGGPDPEDRCKHFVYADDADDAVEVARQEMWGAMEPGDAIRVAGPYPRPNWSEWGPL